MAGGGIRGGQVYGSSDRYGELPADRRPLREAMTSEGLVTAPEGTTLDEAEAVMGRNRI